MFERFTDRARQVVVLAYDEARRLGHAWIGTDHLLLGVLREGGAAAAALEAGGLTFEQARDGVAALSSSGEAFESGQIPFTVDAKKALELSLRESERLEARDITPSHLVLGLLALHSGSAACLLSRCGVDTDLVIGGLGLERELDVALYRVPKDPQPDAVPTLMPGFRELSARRAQTATPERLTDSGRRAVVLAEEEARAFRHGYVGTEHILLGLLREDGLASQVLKSLDITLEEVRVQVARIIGQGDDVDTERLPLTPRAKKLLELALREALSLGHDHIDTEHILLGLVSENEGVAVRILLDFDADAAKIRAQTFRMLSARRPNETFPVSDAAMRTHTIDQLIDDIRAAKEVAIENSDFEQAKLIRDAERDLLNVLRRIPRLIDGEQDAKSDLDPEG